PELLQKASLAPPGGWLEVASVQHRRTFCFVEDAVRLIRLAADAPACLGQTLNIGNQSPEITMGELAQLLLSVVGKELQIHALPDTPGSPPRRCPDMSKTVALTGTTPVIGLQEGILRTYEWYRSHVFSPASHAA